MSGVCGWSNDRSVQETGGELITRMAATLTRHDGHAIKAQAGNGWALACTSRNDSFEMYEDAELIVAIAGKPRLRAGGHGSSRPTAGVVAGELGRAFAQRGVDCLQLIEGEFAFAITVKQGGKSLLAIDRMGIAPLYYAVAGASLVFGSSTDAINLHPLVNAQIDAQGLFNYVYFNMVPGPGTIYAGQKRLLPGHYVLFEKGKLSSGAYWTMNFDEHHKRPFAELRAEFLALLQSAVGNAAADGETGAFMSGGTDSSTLAGMLGKVTGKPARTYSIGFQAEGYDEMEYARLAARHFGTSHHEYYVTPEDVADAIPRVAAVHAQPFGNSSAVPTFYCATLARKDGIDTLLGGDGGDELFGGNDRYATQHIFSLYQRIPALARKAMIEPLLLRVPGTDKLPLLRKARGYVEKALMPMPARLEAYNLLERFGHRRIFKPEFLATIDPRNPLALLNAEYHDTNAHSLINHMLHLDFKFTLADNDLPKVSRSCELARVGIAYPMLDDNLVAFSARLEPYLKLKGTRLRYFFKEALRGFLPDAVITKTKHGFGLPFGPWLQANKRLQDLAYGSLSDLKQRGIIEPKFIDDLISVHVADHPGYYGNMVWVLMMLEQWFQHHRS